MSTSAFAAAARTIMWESWPLSGSSWSPLRRARTSSSRSTVPSHAMRQPARQKLRPRLARALQRAQRRTDEQLEPDERRDGVPRKPKTSDVPAHRKGDRLAGLHRDPPEDLLRAELCEGRAHEVVRADRHAAGRDQHVVLERLLERCARRGRVVGDDREDRRGGAGHTELRRDQNGVRLVDLAGSERRPRVPRNSLPVESTATRGRRPQRTTATPAAASAETCGGPSGLPAATTTSPALVSPPRGRTLSPLPTTLHHHLAASSAPPARPRPRPPGRRRRSRSRRPHPAQPLRARAARPRSGRPPAAGRACRRHGPRSRPWRSCRTAAGR